MRGSCRGTYDENKQAEVRWVRFTNIRFWYSVFQVATWILTVRSSSKVCVRVFLMTED